jgi:serine/threonine protein kinase
VSSSPSTLLATHANCLAIGSRVSDFEIIGLIGEGGFGIVYLAKDVTLDRIVALKEFMPAAFAGRIDGVQVAVRAANHRAMFDAGLKSFINESKMLAKFAHPALVEVFRFWEGNGTGYMAMRLYRGETLRQVLSKGEENFTEERIAQIMAPIFDALEMLHREQVFHRDIAPDNIMLSDGRSVLLDFGSARKIIGDATQALTTVLKPGYAPLEQYSDDGTMKQGSWTDVYALGGVLYHLATGKTPLQAVSRMMSDPLQTVNQMTGDKFSTNFSQAVSKAMMVHVDNRFQTVTEFREALGWNVGLQPRVVTLPNPPRVWLEPEIAPKTGPAAVVNTAGQQSSSTADRAVMAASPRPAATSSNKPALVVAALSILAIVGGVAFWQMKGTPAAPAPAPIVAPTPSVTPSAPAPSIEKPVTEAVVAPPVVAAEGLVKFDIKPRGRIDIDGITRGFSPPLTERRLSVGTHTIEIFNPPAAPVTRTIEVTEGTPVTVSHTFK